MDDPNKDYPMLERVKHIGPAMFVQGGISSVLSSYQKLFKLPSQNFSASYNGSFIRSLPILFLLCLKILLKREKDFDYYQIHTSADGSFFRKFLISLCLRLKRRKYLAHIHGSRFQEFCQTSRFPVRFCIRSYLKNAIEVICITEDMRDFIKKEFGDHFSFSIVPNPCDTLSKFPANLDRREARPVKILFAGRYGKRKGVYDLIEAFDKANFAVTAELHLFGDGEVEMVQKKADAFNTFHEHKKIFVSDWLRREKFIETLSNYDFLTLPSYSETFGMSLVEAMGQGLPVLSTFSGGIPFVVRNNEDGFLVHAGDISALTEKLEKLTNDKSLRIQMGNAAWNHVQNSFSAEVIRQKLESCYKKCAPA